MKYFYTPILLREVDAFRYMQLLPHVTHPNDYPDDLLITLDKSCHTKADAQDGDFKYPSSDE